MKEKINLVLAGGGVKASFQIGVIEELLKKYDIDTVTGTSAGALNAVYTAVGKFDKLKEIWIKDDLKHIFLNNYKFGIFQGILFEKSLYDNKNFLKFLNEDINLDQLINSDIKFACVCSNTRTFQKEIIRNIPEHRDKIYKGILASMAIIPAYPPVILKDRYGIESECIDGGYIEGIPAETCMEITENKQLKTFIIGCDAVSSGLDIPQNNVKSSNIFELFMNTLGLCFDSVFDYNFKYGKLKYWDNNDNMILIKPLYNIMNSSLEFDTVKIKDNIEYGKEIINKYIKYII